MHECDCCKSEVYAVNEHDLCFSCACVRQCAAIIEDETELDANASVDLAMELIGLVRSRILERLLDDVGSLREFIADVKLGMAREGQEH